MRSQKTELCGKILQKKYRHEILLNETKSEKIAIQSKKGKKEKKKCSKTPVGGGMLEDQQKQKTLDGKYAIISSDLISIQRF